MARFISRDTDSPAIGEMVVEYLARNGQDLSFTRCFWKACEPNKDDFARYSRFVQAILRHVEGVAAEQIADEMQIGLSSIKAWISFKRNSKLTDYLRALIRLGKPRRGWVWLSINNTPGRAIPLGPFIEVPEAIGEWQDVKRVLDQLGRLRPNLRGLSREYMFGFLLGVMIGDASKKRQAKWHRHIELVLSKKYDTNVAIGDFLTECSNEIGIVMRRMRDQPVRGQKPHGFCVWESQSTALVDWLFNVCLGLRDDELTTYNPVRMDWAIHSPTDFRRGLVQGMAESDGSVNIPSQTVEFWIGPNWDFVRRLLLTFGVRSFQSREALAVTKSQILKLHDIPAFAPHLKTIRYEKFEKLAKAKHVARGKRISRDIRELIATLAQQRISVPDISERILERYGIVLTFEAVQRWATRTRHNQCNNAKRSARITPMVKASKK